MYSAGEFKVNFGTYKPNVFINQWDTMYYYDVWFLPELILQFFSLAFLLIGFHIIFISILCLLKKVTVAQHMHCFFKTSYSPMFFPIYYFHPIRVDGFPFPSIYGQPYLTFRFHLEILLFNVHLALLLMYGLAFVYFTTTAWDCTELLLP